ncbi:MAG: SDR family NAD(P)-dependent oxidoreductase [Bacteroidetes bacterium]|nr:MAG: SDR family NAD(P)-dependent oxidoreductase [Bacteroidota bacterium]
MMKVLVTGAEGFIGSHLVEHLLASGDEVRAFVLYNSFNSNGWIDTFSAEQRAQIEVFPGDIRDAARVREAMEGVEAVYHLAALISIPYSYAAAASFVEVNVNGTLNVLQAAQQLALRRVLVVSSSEVYGTAQYIPMDEAHPLQPQSPYSASKIGAESLARAFFYSYHLPVTVVRPFNTYGPRQSARAFIPAVITQLLAEKPALHLGDLSPRRDLTYVKDTVAAMRHILECEATVGEVINIATGADISMSELAAHLIALLRPGTEIVQDSSRLRPEASEVRRLLGSAQKLRSLTGWQPEYSMDQGLEETITWFKQFRNSDHLPSTLTHY